MKLLIKSKETVKETTIPITEKSALTLHLKDKPLGPTVIIDVDPDKETAEIRVFIYEHGKGLLIDPMAGDVITLTLPEQVNAAAEIP
jgi:hypothetical protein